MASERVQRRIDRLLDEAEAAADSGDWQAVHDAADRVLAVDGGNQDALSFIAMAERGSGVGDKAASTPIATTDSIESTGDDTPTSFANGRYEVTDFLGEGGKKKVYLAHDTTLDRDVAFALIKIEGLDDASRQRVTREAQAMARLGDNPNIMPIFDLGDENGQPYMVQPVMGGGDVEALIEDAEDGRLSLEEALRIAIEICRGLEFAHSKGIIHRDLKPGNVWLTDDGTVRIGDFGLALSLDRSRLTQEKMMVGTVSYMPPEQATGGEVTPRSDLYSLGAMLYEMVTGRPPFMGDDEIAIIGQHINTPPVAPSWHNQSLPQTLDSLIMRLLAKDPAERPESAAEVLQALEAIDPADAAAAHEEGEGSLDSMSGGVFVGRHREMDQLKATFEDTLGGHGKMVALVGEPGIGKTRTAQELATYASMRGGQVLWGRCYEGGGAPPYWPWVQAIRSYIMDRDAETVRREMGSTASVIAEIVPDVKERLPDVQAPPQIDDSESARFRLFDSITTFLKTASSAQPIVLMLEDLHWSDKPSLMLLEFVARELSNSRLMIIGNYRDMELNRRHPLSITLGELSRERLFDRVLLRGLQKHDVHRFIEVAAGIDPPTALVDAVHTQTEGNPLFVTETVRLLIQEGDIASGAKTAGGTSSWEIRIPEGVREVIGRRLDKLSERCNEVLTTAAVMGRQFRFGVLMKLVEDASENMLLDVLDEALEARILEEVPSEVGLYQFSHALMRETLMSELSHNRAVRLHALIAEAMEDFYGDEAEENAAELVGHFAEAETILGTAKLVNYGILAGERALQAHALDDAAGYFELIAGIADGHPDPTIRARYFYGQAQPMVESTVDDTADLGWEYVGRAFEAYLAAGDPQTAVKIVQIPTAAGSGKGKTELTRKALDLAEPGSIDAGALHLRHYLSLTDDRMEHLDQAIAIAKSHDDPRLEAATLIALAQHDFFSGQLQNVVEYCDRAAAIAFDIGAPQTEMRSITWGLRAHLVRWEI
ncbi:MAG: protein kinase, partial [Chloroflexi bacterium]|nr:protein kinase [Chloroflexota bacterium]